MATSAGNGRSDNRPFKLGQSAETTTTLYDKLLRPWSVTQPDGTTVYSTYLLTGELAMQYGSRTYPVGYSYDYAGRMHTMTNWSSFNSLSGARVTTWLYDGQRGWLTNKVYADGHGPVYTYTPAGRLQTRSWVRTDVNGNPISASYAYDASGALTNILYSDSTPSVTNGCDRLGRVVQQTTANYQANSVYNLAGSLLSESVSGGPLNGLTVSNQYDSFLRRTNLAVLNASRTVLANAAYGYDAASRLKTVTDGNSDVATYSYLANSALVGQIGLVNGSTSMTTSKQYDYLNRLTQISSQSSASIPAVAFNYSYNTANQRTKDKLADGSYWVYQYDSLGQVTNGLKYFSDNTIVPGQQFNYTFDTIGNRSQTKAGGDQNGANQRLANYAVNTLNQITSRDYPGTNDVIGVALATNSVTVNGVAAFHKWEYYWGTVSTNNTSSAKWEQVAVASGGSASAGGMYVPQTREQFVYDLDGNLLSDGHWNYTWDLAREIGLYDACAAIRTIGCYQHAYKICGGIISWAEKNRLVAMTNNTGVGPLYGLTYAYGAQGRRIQKTVTTNGMSFTTLNFAYDGWNPIAILNSSSSILTAFTWGSDLSGSQQGAGGVGGLLTVSYRGTATTNCFVAYDGNANVASLINAAGGALVANYEYGPFGEVIRATGPMAKANPFAFQTEFYDWETDKYYAKNRYYDPSPSKWLSRDPFTEPGFYLLTTGHQASENIGLSDGDGDTPNLNDFLTASSPNVYAFVDNDAVNQTDPLGLVVVGIPGAEAWGGHWDEGNVGVQEIGQAVGAYMSPRSLDIWDPYQYLLRYFANAGSCNNEKIKIFGYSWGGISAVKLSRWVGRSSLRNHEIDVYTIDPVATLRLPPTSVPSSVTHFWNRYQTGGQGVYIGVLGIKHYVHGRYLTSYAQNGDSDEVNLNPSDPNGLDHFTIVDAVKGELIGLLKQ